MRYRVNEHVSSPRGLAHRQWQPDAMIFTRSSVVSKQRTRRGFQGKTGKINFSMELKQLPKLKLKQPTLNSPIV
jgi:hypothetical protein